LFYGLCAFQLHFVIAGFDPAIHDEAQLALTVSMDARVKPGHDNREAKPGDDENMHDLASLGFQDDDCGSRAEKSKYINYI
jgi:hypothetical protein